MGDIDGDGDIDIVVGNRINRNRIYLNSGTTDPFVDVAGTNISIDRDFTRSIALGDIDSDGDIDIVAGNANNKNRLYINNGTTNPFSDVRGVKISHNDDCTRSIAVGDLDDDGDLDVVAGNRHDWNKLYLNNGSSTPFTDVAGIKITNDRDDTFSIALGDVDNDDDLDVIAGNWRQPNRYYLNNGTDNPFSNVVGGIKISNRNDDTQSIAPVDIDGDGDIDIIAGNRNIPNLLYLNNGTTNPFDNIESISITSDSDNTESIALGDMDNDGDIDIIAGNRSNPNRLYLNNGTPDPFDNIVGVNISDDSDNTILIALGDIDSDGDLDVIAGNIGHQNRLYLNNGTTNPFADAVGVNITDDSDDTFSIALGDIDDDGDLDVVTGNNGDPDRLYLNNGTPHPFIDGAGLTLDPFHTPTNSVILQDVNGDNRIDLVAGNMGSIHLVFPQERVPGASGDYQTHLGTIASSSLDDRRESILSAVLTATADIPFNTEINYYLSNNGGRNWYRVQSGQSFRFPAAQSDLRWKAELHSLSPTATPVVQSVSITANVAATDIFLSQSIIEEEEDIGTEIGTFSALDIDGGNHSYSMVDGFGSADNSEFRIDGNMLKTNAVFDFERVKSYSIRVRVTDDNHTELEKQFTIGLNDVNDPPTDMSLSDNAIAENFFPGSAIGILEVTDVDVEDIHIFSLPDGVADNDYFVIENDFLLTNTRLDFEERADHTYRIRVRVTDGGGESIEKDFAITVTDVSDSVTVDVQLSGTDFKKFFFWKKFNGNG